MFDLTNDVIDVRDIISRVEELESERDSFVIGAPDGTETEAPDQWVKENADEAAELDALTAVLDELKCNGGDEKWRGSWYPVTLIRDSYFTEYAQELVQDIGDLPNGIPSYIEIDWEATARNIRMDYTSIEIDGETYW